MNAGIVGVGFMGWIHYLAYQKTPGAKVTAICTRDAKKRAGDWRGIKGNFGPPGAKIDLKGIAAYADWKELLKDPNVDLVDICLPPAMHEEVAVAALSAGKHVLCEKPIALSTSSAKRMVAAAKQSGKQLLIGQVLPFMAEYAQARKLIESGKYGKVIGGSFKRIISDPLWLKDFWDPKQVGGPVIDLHIHDAHFIRLLFLMPTSLFSTGRMRGDVVEFVNTQFLFEGKNLSVTASSGVLAQQGRGFTHAFEIYLERATLLYDSAVFNDKPTPLVPFTILTPDGKAVQPKLPEVDGFVSELKETRRSIQSGDSSPILDGALALDALLLCEKQIESVKKQRVVKI